MTLQLPADSGLDLTATTPTTPQTRDRDQFALLSYRARRRFWRRMYEWPAFAALLLETGDSLLLETGDKFLLEG